MGWGALLSLHPLNDTGSFNCRHCGEVIIFAEAAPPNQKNPTAATMSSPTRFSSSTLTIHGKLSELPD